MNNPLFIIDIDHTIIDSDKIEQEQLTLINHYRPLTLVQFREIKNNVKDDSGKYTLVGALTAVFDGLPDGVGHVAKVLDATSHLDYERFYYPNVIPSAKKLLAKGVVLFFSQGERDLQVRKLEPLLQLQLIANQDIFVYADKVKEVNNFLHTHCQSASQLFVFDDHQRYLKAFKDCNSAITTVLIESQEKPGLAIDGEPFAPDLTGRSFDQLVDMVIESL